MFSDYVEVYKENLITNSMKPRMRPSICIGPSGNIQGSIKFMVQDAQNDNTNVNLGQGKRRKVKNPRYFNEENSKHYCE